VKMRYPRALANGTSRVRLPKMSNIQIMFSLLLIWQLMNM
jgi:hypothetical protein